jgi:hypothetical protein
METYGGLLDPRYRVDYSKQVVPPNYVCFQCKASNCKLWIGRRRLLCVSCAGKSEKTDISTSDGSGARHTEERSPKGRRVHRFYTNCIGVFVPALPYESNDDYWHPLYPLPEALGWWEKLPTFPPKEAKT